MLILSRRRDETIRIGENVLLKIVSVKDGRVRIGIDAPKDIPIARGDMKKKKPSEQDENVDHAGQVD
jgi:carbon storage regulator